MIQIPALAGSMLVRAGLLVGALAACYIKGCSDEKERFDNYKAMVSAVGQAAEERTKARIAEGKLRKQETDNAHKAALDRHRRERERLRAELARGGFVPPAGPRTADPSRITFDRAELERALGEFAAGTARLVEEGDEGLIGLGAARIWAQGRGTTP